MGGLFDELEKGTVETPIASPELTKTPRETLEVWRAIPNTNGHYEASTSGRIRRTETQRVLSPIANQDGYLHVSLSHDGKKRSKSIHSLVMAAFVGPTPEGATINHIDTVKEHNWLSKLEFMTRAENIRQGFADGMYPKGENRPFAKLTWESVEQIRKLIGTMPNTKIAAMFGVSDVAIRKIKLGKTWKTNTKVVEMAREAGEE